MKVSKRTRRVLEGRSEPSLEELIESKRSKFLEDRKRIPSLQQNVADLLQLAETKDKDWQVRIKKDILHRVNAIREEINVLRSMRREHEFESMAVRYLRMYYAFPFSAKRVGGTASKKETMTAYMKHSDAVSQMRTGVVDEFLANMNEAPAKVVMAPTDNCPRCEGKHLLLNSSKGIMSCSECGYSVAYLDATSTSTSFDDIVEFSQYSYKRVNHYLQWLALVQGKEAHRVPTETIELVMRDLHVRQKISDETAVTYKRVRESLRYLKQRKAYEHVTQITHRISGTRPPRISSATEEKLKNMFLQMQPAFNRHSPKTRTNFLSYSYVLYRSFQILGLDHMLPCITLLKGRDKLEANDTIFKKMSEDLGWPTFDLPIL